MLRQQMFGKEETMRNWRGEIPQNLVWRRVASVPPKIETWQAMSTILQSYSYIPLFREIIIFLLDFPSWFSKIKYSGPPVTENVEQYEYIPVDRDIHFVWNKRYNWT